MPVPHRLSRPLPVALALALALALMLGPSAAPPGPLPGPAEARAEPPLEAGDRGKRVKRLQRLLGMRADGRFGPATERAVRRFQRRQRLAVDGVVGAGTWRALRRAAGRRPAGSGGASKASRIRLLQRRLGLSADGVFGAQTGRAVRRFQRRRGLRPDGVVGPATWAALGHRRIRMVLKPPRPTTRRGLPLRVRRVIAAANRIARKPYRFGGGHASFRDTGYDCSGSISYALRGARLIARPLDSTGFMRYGSPGRGRWITIYANRGHAFVVINGRRFDTSGQRRSGTRWQASRRSTRGFVARHPPGL